MYTGLYDRVRTKGKATSCNHANNKLYIIIIIELY